MRICLVSLSYPPASTEGIPRQRYILANELVKLGHEVHVITCHTHDHIRVDQGVIVHEIAMGSVLPFSTVPVSINGQLTQSLRLCAYLMKLANQYHIDIVDVPLWAAQGFVIHQRYPGVNILWLQTTTSRLIDIEKRHPTQADYWRMGLERICVEKASGLLGDSQCALRNVLRDYGVHPNVPMGVVHLGLPRLPTAKSFRPRRNRVDAIVVGRLELRKGTPGLFEVLPGVLRRCPNLYVHFIGQDNSANDGWHQRYGVSYIEYFRKQAPDLMDRVIFEGYIDDYHLSLFYSTSDFLISPSIYESFGLIYLEAMRSGLPVITFENCGSSEIFVNGARDGALVVENGNFEKIARAIEEMTENYQMRIQMGDAGLSRFYESFDSNLMAKRTIDFYENVLSCTSKRIPHSQKLYHVLEFLEDGDAVSDITRNIAELLESMGENGSIFLRKSTCRAELKCGNIETIPSFPSGCLILHYAGYSSVCWTSKVVKGRKALYFHNITPPRFFSNNDIKRHLIAGYRQLESIADDFDLLIGDSRYNLSTLSSFISKPKLSIYIYPVIGSSIQEIPYDHAICNQFSGCTNFLFVGRFAPNKRQDRIMKVFDLYWREFDRNAKLWLVGNDRFDYIYTAELERLRRSLLSRDNIIFTGKVPNHSLYAYFRIANIFLCASEHEGFCVPLAQSMAFGVPIIALGAAATPETLDFSPGLVYSWDERLVVEKIYRIFHDPEYRKSILDSQDHALSRFSSMEAKKRLSVVMQFLRFGETNPLLEVLEPNRF